MHLHDYQPYADGIKLLDKNPKNGHYFLGSVGRPCSFSNKGLTEGASFP